MQLFLVFFGSTVLGAGVDPLVAAAIALTLNAAAFLGEIWRGCIEAIPTGQWEAATALGLRHLSRMRYVVLPQAGRIAIAPTVGFLVLLVKSTSLASIIGFVEVTRAGQIINNVTFRPFLVFGLVAVIYFAAVLAAVASQPDARAKVRHRAPLNAFASGLRPATSRSAPHHPGRKETSNVVTDPFPPTVGRARAHRSRRRRIHAIRRGAIRR